MPKLLCGFAEPQGDATPQLREALKAWKPSGEALDILYDLSRKSLDEVIRLTEYEDGKASRVLTAVAFLSGLAGGVYGAAATKGLIYPHLLSVLAFHGLFLLFVLLVVWGAGVVVHAIRPRFNWRKQSQAPSESAVVTAEAATERSPTVTPPNSFLFAKGIIASTQTDWFKAFAEFGNGDGKALKDEYVKNHIHESYLVAGKVAMADCRKNDPPRTSGLPSTGIKMRVQYASHHPVAEYEVIGGFTDGKRSVVLYRGYDHDHKPPRAFDSTLPMGESGKHPGGMHEPDECLPIQEWKNFGRLRVGGTFRIKGHRWTKMSLEQIRELVEGILGSSTYIGRPGWNKSTKGTYTEWRQGQRHRKKPGQPVRQHAKGDWIIPDDPIFEPVVDLETWKIVQEKLKERPMKARNPKSPKLWLSGLLYCASCGKPMYGRIERNRNRAVYGCSTYFAHPKPRSKSPCHVNRIEHDKVEEIILKWLDDTGVDLAQIGAEGRGKRKLPESFFDASLRMVAARGEMRERLGLPDPPKINVEAILDRFAEMYDQELPALREQLKVMRDEQRLAIRSLARLPDEATHAIAGAKKEVADLDQRIRAAEAQTVDSGKKFVEAAEEIFQSLKDWREARDAIAFQTSARRKSEAVRKVLFKMNLIFTPTGIKRPTSVLTDWVFVPVGVDEEASPRLPSDSLQLGSQSLIFYRPSGCRFP